MSVQSSARRPAKEREPQPVQLWSDFRTMVGASLVRHRLTVVNVQGTAGDQASCCCSRNRVLCECRYSVDAPADLASFASLTSSLDDPSACPSLGGPLTVSSAPCDMLHAIIIILSPGPSTRLYL